MAGLTETGFEIKRLADIKIELTQLFIDSFGPINEDPDGIFGLLIGIIASLQADNWERAEDVYYSAFRNSAEGYNLDEVAQLIGLVRLDATNSLVPVAGWGALSTTVPVGTQGSVQDTGDKFTSIEEITLSLSILAGLDLTVDTPQSVMYTLTINGTGYQSDNTGGGKTATQIASELAAAIDSGESNVTGTSDAEDILLLATDGINSFVSGTISALFIVNEVASFIYFESIETGPVLAPAQQLNTIETPVSGLNSIINYIEATPGQNIETDIELRARIRDSFALAGSATFEAIRSHLLQDVSNVTDVFIEENDTESIVGSLPPHSIHCVVQGGANQDVGDEIWQIKPAGIQTYGSVGVTVTDSQGDNHTMKFSRPTPVTLYIDVQMTENTEEDWPTNGETAVREAVLETGEATFGIGDDVILQKLITGIFNNVAGIATASITWDISPGAPPYANTTNITIDPDEIADFDLSRITATMA